MQELDFDSLNKSADNESWCSTFAYWLLVLQDPTNPFVHEAEKACIEMSFQYDVEDQAQDEYMLLGNHDLIPAVFVPVAPVTLALKWSPFLTAITALGTPLYVNTSSGNAVAILAPVAELKETGVTPDEKHFDFLLRHTRTRALQSNALILLVGSPGWAYDAEDFLEEEPKIRKLMEDFGFVYTLRKPANA